MIQVGHPAGQLPAAFRGGFLASAVAMAEISGRIQGITPAAISLLLIHLKRFNLSQAA